MKNQLPLDTWPYHERMFLASGIYRSPLEDTMNNFESKLFMKHTLFSRSLQMEFTSHYHLNINNNVTFSNIICLFNETFKCQQHVAFKEASNGIPLCLQYWFI
jgi:hypothetical protein